MPLESSLRRLRSNFDPPQGSKERIQNRITAHVRGAAPVLEHARIELKPTLHQRRSIWQRIEAALPSSEILSLLDRVRALLTPSSMLRDRLLQSLLPRLEPVQAISFSRRWTKWVAATAVFLLLVKIGPQLFLAPHSIATSAVTLVPDEVVLVYDASGLWTPIREQFSLKAGTLFRTNMEEAKILFHDDIIRLDEHTTVEVLDTASRSEPQAQELVPTLVLHTGRIWVSAHIPEHARGITVKTDRGYVTIHEGSVSIAEGDTVAIEVYNRRAQVTHDSGELFLISGERTELAEGKTPLVKKMPQTAFRDDWVSTNLDRDAMHQREIAQLQHERSIARAGISRSSPLYPVKRVAEKMDLLLTFGEDARVEKKVRQAETRLDEAAALLAEGLEEDATASIAEYKESILALAEDATEATPFLLQRSLVETSAEVAAAKPSDGNAYLLKKAVLEAGAELPSELMVNNDVQGTLFVEGMGVLELALEEGDVSDVSTKWQELQPFLDLLHSEESAISPALRKEARVLLSDFAIRVTEEQADAVAFYDQNLLKEIAAYVPPQLVSTVTILSLQERIAIAQEIRRRIFLYDQQRSRMNQFNTEMAALRGHPDKGSILRLLELQLPDGPEQFPRLVRREIIELRFSQPRQDAVVQEPEPEVAPEL